MGQLISVVQTADDRKKQNNAQEAQDALNVMKQLATTQKDLFHAKLVSSDLSNHIIPIDKIFVSESTIRCSVGSTTKDLSKDIESVMGDFVSKKFMDGISKVIHKGLQELFNNYSANESETTKYMVSVGPLSGVFRIDYKLYSYRFRSDTLVQITNNVLLVCYVVSSADVSKLHANDCRVLVETVYGDLPKNEQKELFEELNKAVKDERAETHMKMQEEICELQLRSLQCK